MFKKLFVDSEEKYLASVIVYGNDDDSILYSDEACKKGIDKDSLLNLCKKGLVLVSYGGVFYTPVCFKDSTTYASVTLWNALATTPAAITLYSKEYSGS